MADLRNSSEIVTQKELEPVLNSSRFDSVTFLRLYNEWKATKDAGTFSVLRKMHEDAGYNNKNIIFGAEQEMHEIAAIVQRYQDSKNQVTATAATAASGVRQNVGTSVAPAESPVVSQNLNELNSKLQNRINTPITSESLKEDLALLDTEKSPGVRAMIINTLWSRLAGQKYNMTLQGGKISLENPSNTENAIAIEAMLNNQLAANKIGLNEIQSAIMTGTRKFGSYAETQSADITKASLVGYVDFLTKNLGINLTPDNAQNIKLVQSHTKATAEEKAFLITYLTGGYAGYNVVPDLQKRIELKKQNIELHSSSVFLATEKIVGTASAGKLATEKAAMKQGGKSEELTLDAFMDNPTIAIAKYPWTSLTLLIAGIWKFGFMKTIGGLLVGSIGLKALNEIGTETGLGKQIKDGLKKGAKVAGEAAEEAFDGGKAAAASAAAAAGEAMKPDKAPEKDINLTPAQQLAQKEVIKEASKFNSMIQSHAKAVPNQSASLDEYVSFLHSSEFQNQKLGNILYSQNTKASIFQNEKNWDLSIRIPGNMDPVILKKIFRQYLTGSYMLDMAPQGSQEGDKERSVFEKKYSISEKDKNKTIKDILPNIYK